MIRSLRPAAALMASVAIAVAGLSAVSPSYAAVAKPAVGALSVHAGALAGGTKVTVTGKNFTKVKAVKFGAVAGSHPKVVSSTKLIIVSPKHAAGLVDLHVITAAGSSAAVKVDRFRYISAPKVTKVTPAIGNTAGGVRVTIGGVNFFGVKKVLFGGTLATGLRANAAGTVLSVVDPAHIPGSVHVRVYTAFGTSALVSSDAFTYVATPTVSGIAPATGPTAGGTSVTVTGSGFDSSSQVAFGSALGTNVAVSSPTTLTVTAPPGGPGTVDVVVSAAGGLSPTTGPDQFTYVAPPTVSSVSPAAGPTIGGTSVTVTGTNFTSATSVKFGGRAASAVAVNSSTSLTATTPAGAAGAADVTVSTVGGTSATSPVDQFTYVAPPTISGISPVNGPVAGGTTVTVNGTNFTSSTSVTFGSTAASVTVNSPTQLTVTSPAGSAGPVDVRANTLGGSSTIGAGDVFTYFAVPTVTGVAPATGPLGGGTSVTISGTNLGGATAVKFGTASGTGVTVNGAGTSLTVTSPAGGAGAVDVRVTTPGGISAAGAADKFTYADPNQSGPSGSVAGTITDASSHAGLGGVNVYVYTLPSGSYASPIGSATTAANGTYSIDGVPAASNDVVCFDASAVNGTYASQCSNNVPWYGRTPVPSDAAQVAITANATTTVNGALSHPGSITGTVTDASSGSTHLGGVQVYVYDLASGTTASPIGSATTIADGTYTVTGVAPGSSEYAVCFDGSQATGGPAVNGYASQCNHNVPWGGYGSVTGSATPVSVTTGAATTVDAALARDGAITGAVKDASATSSGVVGATVYVYELANGQIGTPVSQATTTTGGSYTVSGVPASSSGYAVCVDPAQATGPSTSGYLGECYQNSSWSLGTQPVTAPTLVPVSADNITPGVNVLVSRAAAIAGTVTGASPSSGGVSNAEVYIYELASGQIGTPVGQATTGANGAYSVTGLSPASGGYAVCVDASGASGSATMGYQSQCYQNVSWGGPGTQPASSPGTVPAALGVTSTANLAVAPDGAITGTVAVDSGSPANVSVNAYDPSGNEVAWATPDSNTGAYTINGLTPGVSYNVCFDASAAGFASQCYNDVPWTNWSAPTGNTVTVASGQTNSNINATFAHGSISGTVTAAGSSSALSNVEVTAYDPSGNGVVSQATDSSGHYQLTGLDAGTQYTVCFADFGLYGNQCYRGVGWSGGMLPGGTQPVSVTAGGNASGIDAALQATGTLSGTVTAAVGGVAVGGVAVRVFDSSGSLMNESYTGSDGKYQLDQLSPGVPYVVCFDTASAGPGAGTGYLGQCYQGVAWSGGYQPPAGGTTAVSVPAGGTMTINAQLQNGGAVSGTITSGGSAVDSVHAVVYDSTGFEVGQALTGGDGTYAVVGLQTGSYTVCFDARGSGLGSAGTGFLSQCDHNVAWSGGSTPQPVGLTQESVTAGSATTVNAQLAVAGAVSGKVIAKVGGAGIQSIHAVAIVNGHWLGGAVTAADGSYTIGGLVPGTSYDICFVASGPYRSQCYQGLAWTAHQTIPSGVTTESPSAAGQTVSGINAALDAFGTISGKASVAAGGAAVSNVRVILIQGGSWISNVWTAADGTYTMTIPDPNASYNVCFVPASTYASQCYQGKTWVAHDPIPAGATTVSAALNTNTPNIDASLS